MLYSDYPADPRPRRAAEAMIEAGMTVDLLCLRNNSKILPIKESIGGVNVTRVSLSRHRDGKLTYLFQYSRFFCSALWFLTRRSFRVRYDVVHVHNMPDFLIFAAIVPKVRGASLILDLHDPMPELMMSIYGMDARDWRVALLKLIEKHSINFAHLVLTPNIAFRDLFASRNRDAEKVQIVMNTPEEAIFDPDRCSKSSRKRSADAFVIMHHGSILHRHGIDLLVAAVALLRKRIPSVQLHIYGQRERFLDHVLKVAEQVGAADIVFYHGRKSQEEIAAAICDCDIGVIPNRISPFTQLNFPTRLFEYLCMQRPVLAPATRGIRDYFGPEDLLTFEAENIADLAGKLQWVHDHPTETRQFVERGVTVYQRHLWRVEKGRLMELIAPLLPAAASRAKPYATPFRRPFRSTGDAESNNGRAQVEHPFGQSALDRGGSANPLRQT